MKKIIPIVIVVTLIISCQTMQTTVKPPENIDLPEKAKFLAQSCSEVYLFQSLIDLENNELVVLQYDPINGILSRVFRTGIFLNANDYALHAGTDAPFAEEEPMTGEKNNTAAGT